MPLKINLNALRKNRMGLTAKRPTDLGSSVIPTASGKTCRDHQQTLPTRLTLPDNSAPSTLSIGERTLPKRMTAQPAQEPSWKNCFRKTCISLWIATFAAIPAFATNPPAFKKTNLEKLVRIAKDDSGQLTLFFNHTANATFEKIQASPSGITVNGLHALVLPENGLQIETTDNPAEIVLADFGNSRLRLEPSNRASLHFQVDRQIVDIAQPNSNGAPLLLSLPDGGAAEIRSLSKLRLDYFQDAAYYVSGEGSVTAWSAEGQELALSPKLLPMTGGPLVAANTAAAPLIRTTPKVVALISGALDSDIHIQIANESFNLAPGERKTVRLPNGTALELWQNPNRRALVCTSHKGYCEFEIRAVDGWQAVCLSDQSIALQWDSALHVVDLVNLSKGIVLVNLPQHNLARVDPRATFQYSYINSFSFGTAATGGHVTLFNSDAAEETKLETRNLLFVGGHPEGQRGPKKVANLHSVQLAWNSGLPVELSSLTKNLVIPPGTEKIIEIDAENRLALRYDDKGELQVTAIQGSFQLHLSALSGMVMRLTEGDSASMVLDARKGLFTIETSQQNGNMVALTTPAGWSPELAPSENLRINLGKDGSMTATSNGKLLLYESAGTEPTKTAQTAQPLVQKDLDVIRIVQPVASPQ